MHYYCLVATKEDPRDTKNYEPVERVLRPYSEYGYDMEDDMVQYDDRFWDWWVAGGRFASRITPDENVLVYVLGDVRHIIMEDPPYRLVGYGRNTEAEAFNPAGRYPKWREDETWDDVPFEERAIIYREGAVAADIKALPDDAFITIVDYHS